MNDVHLHSFNQLRGSSGIQTRGEQGVNLGEGVEVWRLPSMKQVKSAFARDIVVANLSPHEVELTWLQSDG